MVLLSIPTVTDPCACDFGNAGQVESAESMPFIALCFILWRVQSGEKGDGEAGRRMGAADAEALDFSDELRRRRRLFLMVAVASRCDVWSLIICLNIAILNFIFGQSFEEAS